MYTVWETLCYGTLGSAVERRSGSKCRRKRSLINKKGRHRPKTELKQSIIQTDRVAGVWCLNRPSGWATAVCLWVSAQVCGVRVKESGRIAQVIATSGGERKQDRAQSHNRTPPSRNGFQTFPQNRNPKVWEGVWKGGGMAGQARVAAEGLEMEVDRSSRVVAAEQKARVGLAEQGVWLWAP